MPHKKRQKAFEANAVDDPPAEGNPPVECDKVDRWTCEDVGNWLRDNGFGEYVELFTGTHRIDGPALISLTEEDLRNPPLNLPRLGDVKRLLLKLRKLQMENRDVVENLGLQNNHLQGNGTQANPQYVYLVRRGQRQDSVESDFSDVAPCDQKVLDPEPWKTLLSFVYVFSVFLLTAFVMVVVHDRVPDMQKYPPLPDFFLDNMPLVPWAFTACEVVGVVLSTIMTTILVFHKHRFIVLRRLFSITGTIFLLRCVTMFITSLSVPGRHLNCTQRYGDWWSRINRTLEIWKGLGMSMQGVRTCGDYMFSGHTAVITTLNFFITEYTPRNRLYLLHTFSWALNLFGIFFILAAHEHYSIDVFVSFYLTSRLFLYYHTLANNRALMQHDAKRTRIWFPLFAFFESKCTGIVPNVYEWPLPWPRPLVEYFEAKKRR